MNDESHGGNGTTWADAGSERQVGELVTLLTRAARSRQLYEPNNPAYRRTLDALAESFARFFVGEDEIQFFVNNDTLRWGPHAYATGEGRDSLAFVFFRDGVYSLTMQSGFENELDEFLELVRHARAVDREGDDVITLLWQKEFDHLQYAYRDLLADGVMLPEARGGGPEEVPPEEVRADLAEEPEEAPPERPDGLIDPSTFTETLYFLSASEVDTLRQQVEQEWSRDVTGPVLTALFDRLEERRNPGRQAEILGILEEFVPLLLARGELGHVAGLLKELADILSEPALLGTAERETAERIFERMSDPEGVAQFVAALEDGSILANPGDLALFLGHLRPTALPALVSLSESAIRQELRQRLREAMARVAAESPGKVADLLESPDPDVLGGAARLASELNLRATVPRLAALLVHPEPQVRVAAARALGSLSSSDGVQALRRALVDAERDVRVAATRALGSLRYAPAAADVRARLEDRAVDDLDLTEKLALFETYADLAGGEAVPLLDRLLNGRKLLGRKSSPDLRACAARGLGRAGTPAARTALERAREDEDPVVRNAVARALESGRAGP
ncbi:MAG TPA: HEAT repeat domain-containing protein [Vicinamibacteria bacterium]|nr:HEAT repeat domain-containing protein [Vicinamibacteria bacterium]